MRVTLLSLIIYLVAPSAHAVCNQYSCTGIVSKLVVSSSIKIQLDNITALPTNCTAADGYMTVPLDALRRQEQFTTLLLAETTRMKVTVRTKDNSTNCEAVYVTLHNQ